MSTAMLATALPVEVVSTHRDWLDYAAAAGGVAGVVGALVAIAALVLAKKSADDASISAKAAEKSLAIMSDEAQAARRLREQRADPVIELHAKNIEPSVRIAGEAVEATDIVLTLGFRNEGDRTAEYLTINFLIPDSLTWEPCDQFGNPAKEGQIAWTSELLGDHRAQGTGLTNSDASTLAEHSARSPTFTSTTRQREPMCSRRC
jgi:hypothetical protein